MKNSRKYARTFTRKEHVQDSLGSVSMARSELVNANVNGIGNTGDVDSVIQSALRRSIFWSPSYLGDAWNEYAPFAFWVVDVVRPKLIVEAGRVSPVSYFAFCQAVDRLGLDSQCVAVDILDSTEENAVRVRSLQLYSDQHYGAFSSVIRHERHELTAPPALFNKGAIDVLHFNLLDVPEARLDGNLKNWLDFLSDRGLLLLSGTSIQSGKPRLREFLSSLKDSYPVFELTQGLGVSLVCVGKCIPEPLSVVFNSVEVAKSSQALREIFYRIGRSYSGGAVDYSSRQNHTSFLSENTLSGQVLSQAGSHISNPASELAATDQIVKELEREAVSLRRELERRNAELTAMQKERNQLSKKADELQSFKNNSIDSHRKAMGESVGAFRLEINDMRKHAAVMEEELLQSRKAVGEHSLKINALGTELKQVDATRERQTKELATLTRLLLQTEEKLEKVQSQLTTVASTQVSKLIENKSKEEKKSGRLPNLLKVFGGNSRSGKKDGGEKFLQAKKLLLDSALFDENWYLENYPDVANSSMSSVEHYLTVGASLGYDPSANFDSSYYLDKYRDVASSGMNPLVHYLRFGINEGRKPKAN